MLGQTISHYRIVKKLGQGGMGVVYQAEDTKLKRTVALKFLPPQTLSEEEYKIRFLQEAQAAAGLDHPNILAIRNADWIDGRFVLATDLAEKNLAEYAGARRSGSLALQVIRDVTRGACVRARSEDHAPRREAQEYHVDA